MTQCGGSWCWPCRLVGALVVSGTVIAASVNSTFAQIEPDSTLGTERSSVKRNVQIKGLTSDRIKGGARRGANLFHSFQEFNVDQGRGAYFTNPVGVKNILSRVTGKNRSDIQGTLGVLGKADLFLINPNGIIFSPNARLDIKGSFLASTADGIQFKENEVFSATEPQSSTLLSVEPGALFANALAQHQAAIRNQGGLAVGKGQTLTLQGGSVNSSGSAIAPGGTVQVLGKRVGLFGTALIDVSSKAGGGKVLIGGDFQGKGNVPTAARTYIGPDVTIKADALTSGNGGRVIAWADEVTGFDGTISAKGGSLSGDGGFVEVSGQEHLIFRGQVDTSAAKGLPGTLLLDPTNITIANGSRDSTGDGPDTFRGNNSKKAGSILSAPLSEIDDTAPTTIYESELEGLSGNTNVVLQATNNITLNDLADNELTFAAGKGSIALTADADSDGVGNFVMLDNGSNYTASDALKTNARDIKISAANLTLGRIDTSSSSSVGDAGDGGAVFLRAEGDIMAGDINSESYSVSSSSFDSTSSGDAGNGGAVTLRAGGDITANYISSESYSSSGSSFGSASSGDAGNGGTVTLRAGEDITANFVDSRSSSSSSSVSSSASSGDAGNGGAVTLRAGGDIMADINADSSSSSDSNSSSASSGDAGNGGAVTLKAGGDITTENISSDSSTYSFSVSGFGPSGDAGNGGTLTLRAGGDIDAYLIGSTSASTSSGDAGNGGTVTLRAEEDIDAYFISSFSSSTSFSSPVSTSSSDAGDGGAVTLRAGEDITANYISSGSSSGSTSSGNAGNGGAIALVSLNGSIIAGSLDTSNRFTSNPDASSGPKRGDISLKAKGDITLDFGVIEASGIGTGGNIILTSQTGAFSLENGVINSNAFRQGDGGEIQIKAKSATLTNTELTTTATGAGNAGNIHIAVPKNDVSLDRSRLFTSLEPGGIGKGGDIEINGGAVFLSNFSFIDTATFGRGDAGNVSIKADSLSLDSSSIFSITAGQGNGGNVIVQAQDALSLANRSNISTAVNSTGVGQGGQIKVEAGSMKLTDGSQLQALTRGAGDSGNIELDVKDSLTISGISSDGFLSGVFTSSEANTNGKGGNIQVTTPGKLLISDGAVLNAQTSSSLAGGDITVDVQDLELSRGGQVLTSTSSSGVAGNIIVKGADSVIISGADPDFEKRVSPPTLRDDTPVRPPTTIREVEPNGSSTQGQVIDAYFSLNSPNATNPDIEFSTRIPHVSVSGTSVRSSDMFLDFDYYSFEVKTAGTRGIFDLDQKVNSLAGVSPNLSLLDRKGNLLAKNYGESAFLGASGSTLDDPYLRYVFPQPGTYFIAVEYIGGFMSEFTAPYTLQVSRETPNVLGSAVSSGAASGLFANTASIGKGGNIKVDTNLLRIADGALIDARTTGKGNTTTNPNDFRGGNLTIRANTFEARSGGQLRTTSEGTGRAGDITIKDGEKITLTGKDSGLFVNTALGSIGAGGNVQLQGNSLTLDNGASVSAETASNTGGNITLQLDDLLLLRDNNTISATAGTAQAGGNGGNIQIDTDLIIAVPNEDSDITANAFKGQGGTIGIEAQSVFGLQERPATPGNRTNDIDASSQLGVAGTIDLNTPDVDPSQGLAALPEEVVDVSGLIAQTCPAGSGPRQSKFVVTGRGGVPPNPGETLSTDAVQVDLVTLNPEVDKSSTAVVSPSPSRPGSAPMVEAQGWVRDAKGKVVLTASASAVAPHSSWQKTANCQKPER